MGKKPEVTNINDLSEKKLFELYYRDRDINVRNQIVSRYMYLADIDIKEIY